MLDKIIQTARDTNKQILILAAPRTGTHALGQEIAVLSGAKNFGEICMTGYCDDPWQDIHGLIDCKVFAVGHVVQLTPKMVLAENVEKIKKRCVLVNIKRKDLVSQFASSMYFRVLDPTGLHGWHNHSKQKTRLQPGQIVAKKEDIDQFKLEQMLDEYFFPDFRLCYETMNFSQQKLYQKNQFSFPLPQMFSNLDFVQQQLGTWKFTSAHLGQNE